MCAMINMKLNYNTEELFAVQNINHVFSTVYCRNETTCWLLAWGLRCQLGRGDALLLQIKT
jgi:hypothetical protein